jgi:hypothetical protein
MTLSMSHIHDIIRPTEIPPVHQCSRKGRQAPKAITHLAYNMHCRSHLWAVQSGSICANPVRVHQFSPRPHLIQRLNVKASQSALFKRFCLCPLLIETSSTFPFLSSSKPFGSGNGFAVSKNIFHHSARLSYLGRSLLREALTS